VARERAADEGMEVTFKSGHAASIPLEDASADAVVSVFAVIFAPDPARAVAEMDRVLAPGGRIVFSAWIPSGAVFEMVSTAERAVRQALGAPESESFAWHDPDSLSDLFGSVGFQVGVDRHELTFTGVSAGEFLGSDQPSGGGGRLQPPRIARPSRCIARATARQLRKRQRGTRTIPHNRPLCDSDGPPQLSVSTKTVNAHVEHMYTKLGVTRRGAAALYAMRHALMAMGNVAEGAAQI
jgi:SAM-dependent methyltransferase